MKFAIFKKSDKDVSKEVKQLLAECKKYNFIEDENNPDLVFVLGGDGTFLKAVHHYLDKLETIKFIGFKLGSLGFFYDFSKEDIAEVVKNIDKGDYLVDSHKLLECKVKGKIIYAVNEIGVGRTFHSVECSVKINNDYFEEIHGNGLLVCSPLGSTGYNRSLGGSVIHNDLDVIQLTEISSIQNNVYRSLGTSLILSGDSIITLDGDFNGAKIGYDHWSLLCEDVNHIEIRKSNKKVNIIFDKKHDGLTAIKRSFVK